ncbi:alpha/beta hydrolase [Jannaschia aquimarina]|uniref:YtpA protein n=1 Tax=Jannaschia aquimarina TaxID=935700 RepID=A0A0D1D8D0_9RHOB|nr:alpha/beta hydrolase [Jannaschia aquimarina]KIT16178.1 Phospholipase YtpA [Jannaschia aquimarina]SNT36677.1 lysophospholipase [Jannaschia aquimarina]
MNTTTHPVPAPYHADVAAGPPSGHAVWAEASDGTRVRIALWPLDGARGTVLMFPGRTEYCEKYSDAAAHFAAKGYTSAAIDWRGQGLTERPRRNRLSGHVGDFDHFQQDVEAMLSAVEASDLPRPWHLLAHSMGGLIGLRALMEGLDVASATFSGPMWELTLVPSRRQMARFISKLGTAIGLGEAAAPASGKSADPAGNVFEGNLLTTDPEMFAWMKRQVTTYPDLALGAPSLSWLRAAFWEMETLEDRPSPAVPTLTLLGGDEAIVDPDEIRERMADWPGGTLLELPGLRHEVLMENDETRADLFGRIVAHMDAAVAGAPSAPLERQA